MLIIERERRLPFTAIDAYAARHGIAGRQFSDFLKLIEALDGEYLAVRNEAESSDG